MLHIACEAPHDGAAVETLLNDAFGPGREKKISYRYRALGPSLSDLSLTARDEAGRLVGSIRYWPVVVGKSRRSALLLGPLAVAAEARALGVGGALMRDSLDRAAAAGWDLVLLVGDLNYYQRFGFVPAAPLGFYMPHEQPWRLQVKELAPGAAQKAKGALRPTPSFGAVGPLGAQAVG